MIDEFQDANNSQDLILKCCNGTKIIMVIMSLLGDVKAVYLSFQTCKSSYFMNTLTKSEKYTDDFNGKNAYKATKFQKQ